MDIFNFFSALAAISAVTIAGLGVLRSLLGDRRIFSLAGIIPLSFGVGFGLWGVLAHWIMLFHGKLSLGVAVSIMLPWIGLGLGQIIRTLRRRWLAQRAPCRPSLAGLTWPDWLLGVVIFAGLAAILCLSLAFPMQFGDSRDIWGLKAKMLFYEKTVFSPDFLDAARVQRHFQYPLLFPLSQVAIYLAIGRPDDWAVMLLVGLFFPMLGLFFYALSRAIGQNRRNSLLATAVLAFLPVFYLCDGPAQSGYADTPLAFYYCLSLGCWLLWRQTAERRLFILASILSGLLVLLKNEGLLLILLQLLWIIRPTKNGWRTSLKDVSSYALIVAGVVLPWFFIVPHIPPVADENYPHYLNVATMSQNLARVPTIGLFFLKSLLGFQPATSGYALLYGMLWIIFGLAFITALHERRVLEITLGLTILLFYGAIGLIFVITPHDLFAHLITSFFRLSLVTTAPAILMISRMRQEPG
jgi:hypothetical protein